MNLFPIYVFLGPESGEKAREILEIKQAFKEKHNNSIEEYTLYGFEDGIPGLLELARGGNLFSSGCFIIFREADQIKINDQMKQLEQYIKSPSADCVIVFDSDQVSTTKFPFLKKVTSLIPKQAQKIFWEMFENKRQSWLISYVRSHGGSISREAAELFLELVENNSQDMARECDTLLLLHQGDTEITLEDVERFIFHSKEENAYSIFGYLADRDLSRALEGLHKFVGAGDHHSIPLMGSLVRQFRVLGMLKSTFPKGIPSNDTLKDHGIGFRRAQTAYQTALQKYTTLEVGRIIQLAGQYEFALREFRSSWHHRLLELFCYQVTVRGGQGSIITSQEEPDQLGVFALSH
jgi:DNA polymerase-3 subunit delta